MDNKTLLATIGGSIIGGGLLFGISKGFKANAGWVIVFTTMGIVAGGFVGYEVVAG